MLGRLLPPRPAMNLDSLSLALSQISYLVDNLTKKNYRASQQEIQHVSRRPAHPVRLSVRLLLTLLTPVSLATRLSIVTVLRQTGIYYAVSSPMWILVEMVKAVERIFTRYFLCFARTFLTIFSFESMLSFQTFTH